MGVVPSILKGVAYIPKLEVGTYALRTYMLISLLLTLGTQYIQYISMVVQLRPLARSSMPPQANYHVTARGAIITIEEVFMAN